MEKRFKILIICCSFVCFYVFVSGFVFHNEGECCLMSPSRWRRRGWWLSDWAGEVDGSNYRRPYAACADIQDMDFGNSFVRCPRIHQPILWLQNHPSLRFFCVSTDYFSPTWQIHGQNTSDQSLCFSFHQVVVLFEPWPIHFKGACTHHHLCQCWI